MRIKRRVKIKLRLNVFSDGLSDEDTEGLETLSGLFGSVTNRTRPFLHRSSETKYLAVTDFNKATDQYFSLARQALEGPKKKHVSAQKCGEHYLAVKSAIESGQLGSELVDALECLRTTFIQDVLKPAMKQYMTSSIGSELVENLYESVLQTDGLLEVVQFFEKVQKAQIATLHPLQAQSASYLGQ
jgi:hypothetical protein